MRSQPFYAISGLIIGALVSLVLNLISAGIQQRAFATQFSDQALWELAGLALLGLLIGYWLGEKLKLTTPTASQSASTDNPSNPDIVTMTRLKALLSYGKLKGKGIHLSDIVLIGSRIDIET